MRLASSPYDEVSSAQPAERVVAVRVVAGRDQDQVGLDTGAPTGITTCSTSEQERRLAGARRHRQVDRVALALALAHVVERARCRARTGTGGCSRTAPRGESWKIALVPLPWCTSQSSTSTRSAPSASSACRAAIATFANRQKPIARRALGVVAGRPQRREAGALAAGEQRLRQRARAARRAAAPPRRSPGSVGVSRSNALAARARVLAHAPPRTRAGCTAQQLLLGGRRRLDAAPSRASRGSRARASIARMRSARSGWPKPVSCSSDEGWRKNGGMRAGTVPRGGASDDSAAHRRRGRRRRRRRPLRRPRGRRPRARASRS